MSDELPNHVKKYLKDMGVSEDKLTPEARDMLASLSAGEIALLKDLGKSLEKVDTDVVLKVH